MAVLSEHCAGLAGQKQTVVAGAWILGIAGWNPRFGRWLGPVTTGASLAVMLVIVGLATARDAAPRPRFRSAAAIAVAAVAQSWHRERAVWFLSDS